MFLFEVVITFWAHVNEDEYRAVRISRFVDALSPHYWLDKPRNNSINVTIGNVTEELLYQPNLTGFLASYALNSVTTDYEDHYYYAALEYINGVRHILGINMSRDYAEGLVAIESASRFGCNEATMLLANGHMHGAFGLSKSPKLAYHYYMEIYKSWIREVSAGNHYQQVKMKHYNEILASHSSKSIAKAERQHMIMETLKGDLHRERHGNIISHGCMSGRNGFEEREDIAAYFAYLSAVSDLKIELDKNINGFEALFKQEEDDYETALEEVTERNDEGAIESLKHPTKESVFEKYTYDGVNLLEFDETIPLTRHGFYDGLQKLCKQILSEIYKDYNFFDTFEELRTKLKLKDNEDPTPEQLYNHMLYERRSFAYYATKMFIERTDTMPALGFIRHKMDIVNQGADAYVNDMAKYFSRTREYEESCPWRGQSIALVRYFILKNPELLPDYIVNAHEHSNIARILSLGAAYYKCHMGLTGTAFDDIYGERPDKPEQESWEENATEGAILDDKIQVNVSNSVKNESPEFEDQPSETGNAKKERWRRNSRQGNINVLKKDKNLPNENKTEIENDIDKSEQVYINIPDFTSALMALDVASQAGSFEASYYEALLLNGSLYEFGPTKLTDKMFLYHRDFRAWLFENLKVPPEAIRKLLSHAAHGQLLGGEFLEGYAEFTGFGGFPAEKEAGIAKMKNAAHRIVFERGTKELLEEMLHGPNKEDFNSVLSELLIRAFAGDTIAFANSVKILSGKLPKKVVKGINTIVNLEGRYNENISISGVEGLGALAIELFGATEPINADILDATRRICRKNISICIFSLYGFNGDRLTKREFRFIERSLLEYNEWVILKLGERLEQQKLLKSFEKYKNGLIGKYDDLKALNHAVNKGEVLSTRGFLINTLKKSKGKVSELIYNCYFSSYDEQERLLKSFPNCLTLNYIINSLFGEEADNLREIYIMQNLTHFGIVGEEQKMVERLDGVVAEFLLEFEDQDAGFLFSGLDELACEDGKKKVFWNFELELKYNKEDVLGAAVLESVGQDRHLALIMEKLNYRPRVLVKSIVEHATEEPVNQTVFVSQVGHARQPRPSCEGRGAEIYVPTRLLSVFLAMARAKLVIPAAAAVATVIAFHDAHNLRRIEQLRGAAEEAELGVYDDEGIEEAEDEQEPERPEASTEDAHNQLVQHPLELRDTNHPNE